MRMVKGLAEKLYEGWLRSLVLLSLEKMRLRGDLTVVFHILTRGSEGAGTDLSTLVTSDSTQGNGMN